MKQSNRTKLMKGTLRNDRKLKEVEVKEAFDINPPKLLSLDKIAKEKWKELTEELKKYGLLTNLDRDLLAHYCLAYSQFVELIKIVKKEGKTYIVKGEIKTRPEFKEMLRLLNYLKDAGNKLGLSPEARQRMDIVLKERTLKDDEFENFWTFKGF